MNRVSVLQIGKFHAIQLTWLLVISPPLADAQEILAPLVVSAEAEDGADQEALTTLVGGGDLSNLLQLMPNAYAGGAPGSIRIGRPMALRQATAERCGS